LGVISGDGETNAADAGCARGHITHDHINLVSTRRQGYRFLISRFAIFGRGQFFRSCSCDDRILENAGSASRYGSNTSKDVDASLLQATAILEH
jgi:hypothetical protein